jgi:Glyoxalase-like domain
MICLDCADPAGLAAFWAALLGGEVAPILGDDAVMVKNKGIPVAALRVPGYQPPTWPSGAIPKQVHLDLAVSDLDAAEAEAIRLGARRAGEQPRPTRWRVMLDPAGHPFCLCDWSKELPANRKDQDHGPRAPSAPIPGDATRRL